MVDAVEERFGIEIPDADAERLVTVGMLHAYVWQVLQRQQRQDWMYAQAADEVRRLTAAQLGVDIRRVQLDSHFVEDLGLD